jgi:enoyl-CoA hydratase/carnithine racemase
VRTRAAEDGPAVVVTRTDDALNIRLARPHVHNALDARMRDELLDALAVAVGDERLRVVVSGEGPSFCSGGDLDEFGTFADPATAHSLRLDRSIGAVLLTLADRTTFSVHGTTCGSGIELAAFASRVTAHRDTTIALPELGLGLVPGAGGTVSITARIGRHRTAHLALTRRTIDATTALAWGLVDEVTDTAPSLN